MTDTKAPPKRPYQRHGLRALQGALRAVSEREGWLESLGSRDLHYGEIWRCALCLSRGE